MSASRLGRIYSNHDIVEQLHHDYFCIRLTPKTFLGPLACEGRQTFIVDASRLRRIPKWMTSDPAWQASVRVEFCCFDVPQNTCWPRFDCFKKACRRAVGYRLRLDLPAHDNFPGS